MPTPRLEHLNLTSSDPQAMAAMLDDLFGWQIRWQGEAKDGGHTIHVGNDDTYLAVYAPKAQVAAKTNNNYTTTGGLNHVGVVVDDIDAVEAKVIARGLKPVMHGDYEPGRRFYFHDPDGIEFEVVSYS